jgi:hypothetical protein
VRLSAKEKLEAVHADVRVARSSVRTVEVVDNTLDFVHGLRVGTGIPGSTAIGTFTSSTAKIFGVIHHRKHRGIRILLDVPVCFGSIAAVDPASRDEDSGVKRPTTKRGD